jgi:DNA-binding MarR family transcriptional regulator
LLAKIESYFYQDFNKGETMENTSYLLMKASRSLKQHLDNKLKDYNITASQFSVLYQINQHNNHVIASDVSKALDLDRPTISAIIKRLEMKGIVQRIPNENDKRSEYLIIKKESLLIVNELKDVSDALNHEIFFKYSSNHLSEFHSMLLDIIKKCED